MLFLFSFVLGTISLSLTGTASAAALSTAQPQEPVIAAPHWSPGSSWEYSDGYGLRVSSTENGTTVFQRIDAPGQWFSMRGFLRQDAASATSKRQTVYRTEAPSAGDELKGSAPLVFQREYLSNNQLVVHATSWTVERRERITVPAGTFDCWVIVWRARSLKSNWTGFERWWYSPEAQHYVRLEYKYGSMQTASRVLMRYHLASANAPDTSTEEKSVTTSVIKNFQPTLGPMPWQANRVPRVQSALEPLGVQTHLSLLLLPNPLPLMPLQIVETASSGPALLVEHNAARPSVPLADREKGPALAEVESKTAIPSRMPVAVSYPAPVQPLVLDLAPTPLSQMKVPPTPSPAKVQTGIWVVQVGWENAEAKARKRLTRILNQGGGLLGNLPNAIEATQRKGQKVFYWLSVGSYDSLGDARGLCTALKLKGSDCFVRARESSGTIVATNLGEPSQAFVRSAEAGARQSSQSVSDAPSVVASLAYARVAEPLPKVRARGSCGSGGKKMSQKRRGC